MNCLFPKKTIKLINVFQAWPISRLLLHACTDLDTPLQTKDPMRGSETTLIADELA